MTATRLSETGAFQSLESSGAAAVRLGRLEIDRAVKSFGDAAALRGVSLTLEPGEFAVVVGSNGSGKSTLLQAVAGAFPLDSGRITLSGVDVTKQPEHRRAARTARVFQNPQAGAASSLTVLENLALAMKRGEPRGFRRAVTPAVRRDLSDHLFAVGVGLENRLDDLAGQLSGGQRQALALVMATVRRPEVLLLDEHTAALDPRGAELVLQFTERIVRRERLTTLMVTQSLRQAVTLGDRLIVMARGEVGADFSGTAKRQLRTDDVAAQLEAIRWAEQLDEPTAEFLARRYV
ncbi:MAG: ABC transporter ATP-binding protein [Planctomycetia bacterium]